MDNENKSCENCKFFIQHYVRRTDYLQKAKCGHCTIRRQMSYKELLKFPFAEGCDKWEQAEPKIKTQDEICKNLEDMCIKLQILISYISDSE